MKALPKVFSARVRQARPGDPLELEYARPETPDEQQSRELRKAVAKVRGEEPPPEVMTWPEVLKEAARRGVSIKLI